MFDFQDLGYAVILFCNHEKSILLQGDDAEYFLNGITDLENIWKKGSPNPDVFPTFEDHLQVLIDPYF